MFVRTNSKQTGQVIWLALPMLLALIVALTFMVASGRLFAEKTRLVSAADQAALGAATWRARVLNFDAYANRALLAQDVAVAQALTLVSWARYFEQLTEQTAVWVNGLAADMTQTGNLDAATLGWLTQAATRAGAHESRGLAEQAAVLEIGLRAAPNTGYKALLADTQALLHQSAGVFGLGAVANEIARATDPRYFAFVMSDQGEFAALTQAQTNPHDRSRYAQWLTDSLDPFVKGPRSSNHVLRLPDPCAPGAGSVQLELRKRGVTVLSSELDSWLALDDASIHRSAAATPPPAGPVSSVPLCTGSERLALGWGAAGVYNSDQIPMTRLAGVQTNPVAFGHALDQLAEHLSLALREHDGIATVRDLTAHWRAATSPVTSPLSVLARIDERRLRLTRAVDPSDGHGLQVELPGARLWALSAAQVYFRKPGMPAEAPERASLFSPYWQARLIEPNDGQRSQAQRYAH